MSGDGSVEIKREQEDDGFVPSDNEAALAPENGWQVKQGKGSDFTVESTSRDSRGNYFVGPPGLF